MFTHRISAVAALAAALALPSCSGTRESGEASPQVPVDVSVQAAGLETAADIYEAGGVVRARTTATLASRILAPVSQVLAAPGQRVRAGQVLVRLDARDLQADRARAQAALAAAEHAVRAASANRDAALAGLSLASATEKRIATLRSKNSATPSEYDQAKSALGEAQSRAAAAEAGLHEAESSADAARAALRAAAATASYAEIAAPFDGLVTEKHVEPGNMAAPGAPLLVIEDTASFRLDVRLDEARLTRLDRRAPVDVLIDAVSPEATAPPTLAGRITEVERAIDPGSHVFLVKIELPPSPGLQSGLYGRARLSGGQRRVLAIPASAVARRGQVRSVFVVGEDRRARLRLVQVGPETAGRVSVAAGLEAGEQVVVDPPPTLVDAGPVRVRPSRAGAANPLAPAEETRR